LGARRAAHRGPRPQYHIDIGSKICYVTTLCTGLVINTVIKISCFHLPTRMSDFLTVHWSWSWEEFIKIVVYVCVMCYVYVPNATSTKTKNIPSPVRIRHNKPRGRNLSVLREPRPNPEHTNPVFYTTSSYAPFTFAGRKSGPSSAPGLYLVPIVALAEALALVRTPEARAPRSPPPPRRRLRTWRRRRG
jgi:hypothetical protein